MYAVVHREMNETLQQDDTGPKEEFREQRRRKRKLSDEQIQVQSNSNCAITWDPKALPQVPVRNFFAKTKTQVKYEDSRDGKCTGTDEVQQEHLTRQIGSLPSF
jgi:hypothetical protein